MTHAAAHDAPYPAPSPAELFAAHQRLAYFVAAKFRNQACARGVPVEDVEHEAVVGLLRASIQFDPTRGCTFATFAHKVITHHLYNVIRARR
jgi:RNA polymerase sigma factor (sigma-70 family)